MSLDNTLVLFLKEPTAPRASLLFIFFGSSKKMVFKKEVEKRLTGKTRMAVIITDRRGVGTKVISLSPQEVKLELRCPSQTGCHLSQRKERQKKVINHQLRSRGLAKYTKFYHSLITDAGGGGGGGYPATGYIHT